MTADVYSPENADRTAFFAGHRDLSTENIPLIRERVNRAVSDAYKHGYRRFFCGCALGFDTLAAFETIHLRERFPDLKLSLAVPCESQPDRWPSADRETYRRLLELADDKIILSPVYYRGVMLTRNRYMADRSSLCICWLRNMHSGTAYAVRYALLHRKTGIINLAVPGYTPSGQMREQEWKYMFISPSADRNAITAPLRLSRSRKLIFRNI